MKSIKNLTSLSFKLNAKTTNKIVDILKYLFKIIVLLAIGYIIIYPLLQMIVTSVKSEDAFYDATKVWLPLEFDVKFNFSLAIESLDFFNSLKSTLLLEMVSALLSVFSCAIAAYGFSRFKFKLKGILMTCLFISILIPETMIIIPRVVNYSNLDILGILGLINKLTGVDLRLNIIGTPWAFWLPSIFGLGLRSGILIFIYIQFFKSLPVELEEAAWVDGANPFRTFFSIAIPSSSVVITTVLVFSVIWHWNDSFLASMYMQDKFPLAVSLDRIVTTLNSYGYFSDQNVEAQAVIMAACVLFIIPPLVFYMFMQRKFIESIDRVGITG